MQVTGSSTGGSAGRDRGTAFTGAASVGAFTGAASVGSVQARALGLLCSCGGWLLSAPSAQTPGAGPVVLADGHWQQEGAGEPPQDRSDAGTPGAGLQKGTDFHPVNSDGMKVRNSRFL